MADVVHPPRGTPNHWEDRSNGDVVILEVGDRLPGDQGTYPDERPEGGDGRRWQVALHAEGRLAVVAISVRSRRNPVPPRCPGR